MRIWIVLISILFSATLEYAADDRQDQPGILTKDGRFVVRGQKKFLLGISYFDGLNAPPQIQIADFAELRNKGFNAIRVWGTWYREEQPRPVQLFGKNGALNQEGLFRLRRMLEFARQNELLTILTFSRDPIQPIGFDNYKRGIVSVTSAIQEFRSVLIDVQNETNHCGDQQDPDCSTHLSLSQVGNLRAALRQTDAGKIVTASRNGFPIIQGQDDYRSFLSLGSVDYISTHRPSRTRDAIWAQLTDDEVRQARAAVGPSVPILLDEPNRCYASVICKSPAASKLFYIAARNAKIAGAAGWFFHTKAGYRLSARSIFAQMNPVERQVVANLGRILRPIP